MLVTIQCIIGVLVGNLTNYINTLLECNFNQVLKTDSHSSSETIREDPKVKMVSDHLGSFNRYKSDDEFGYYLAGLIEGDGHFAINNTQVIAFHIKDISLAYYIKKRLGYGIISKVKDKEAVLLRVCSKAGILRVVNLVNGKMRTESKYFQYTSRLSALCMQEGINLQPQDTSSLMTNPWQSGFVDADGSFQIKVLNRPGREQPEIRQAQQIDQKTIQILDVIKKEFGGSIGHRAKQDTYYYSSVNFGVAKKYIDYFQTYNIQSYKYVNYIRWRKVYIMISKKEHLTLEGVNKIKRYKG